MSEHNTLLYLTDIREAIAMIEHLGKGTIPTTFTDVPRIGDHQWYISDVKKFQHHYPQWRITRTVEQIIEELWNMQA